MLSQIDCGKIALPYSVELQSLYAELCAVLPLQYACGRGYGNNAMRFSLEGSGEMLLAFSESGCQMVLSGQNADGKLSAYAAVYGPLFQDLILQLSPKCVRK